MEPNYSGNTNTPIAYPQGPAPEQPKKRWPFSRKVTIIVGVVLVVIVLVLLAILLNNDSGKKADNGKGADRASFYTQRPGFEGMGEGMGDPAALTSQPTNKIVQYRGVNVVQACSIITIKDIRDAGLKIEPNLVIGTIQRTFMDGEGPGILTKDSDSFLPFDDESNHCQYNLDDGGMIDLIVYQPAYTNQKAISYTLAGDYAQGSEIEGFQRYDETRKNKYAPNMVSIFLRNADISAAIRVDTPDKAVGEKMIKLTAQRLRQGLATPTPIEEFVYDSPILTGKTVNGCTLVSNTDFKGILGVDSGPYVDEMMSTAVGVHDNSETKELYNYVTHHCKRRSSDGSTKDKTLTIRVDTYETVEGAKNRTKFEKTQSSTKDLQLITPTVGDESYYADAASLDKAVVIRKGRVVVRVNYYLPKGNDDVSAAQRIQTLTPLIASIANDKLKDY